MNNFRDFDIKPSVKTFVGDKVAAKKILNMPIKVLDFKLEPSKQKSGTELLTLQIEKDNGEKRIVFTGSTILIGQINRVPKDKFPFTTTIIADNDYYEFT